MKECAHCAGVGALLGEAQVGRGGVPAMLRVLLGHAQAERSA